MKKKSRYDGTQLHYDEEIAMKKNAIPLNNRVMSKINVLQRTKITLRGKHLITITKTRYYKTTQRYIMDKSCYDEHNRVTMQQKCVTMKKSLRVTTKTSRYYEKDAL